jgi:hypothetical protein
MSPIVNTDVKMSKAMLRALTIYETYCVASNINSVTENETREFLTARFGQDLASKFNPKFLFSSQET